LDKNIFLLCFVPHFKKICKMKKLILFVAFLGLVSCSSDDNGGSSVNNGDIVGSWRLTALTYGGATVISQGGQSITTNFNAVGTEFFNSTLTFNENGTFESEGDGYMVDYTMEMMGQEITQEMFVVSFFQNGNWEANGNTITFFSPSTDPVDYNVVELNETTLRLTIEDLVIPVNGGQSTMSSDMTLTRL
jgi:hypothetical protein